MWLVIKYKKKRETELIEDLKKRLSPEIEFYIPRIKYKIKNKKSSKEIEENILSEYMFIRSEKFKEQSYLYILKFCKGLISILNNYKLSQIEILNFLKKCKANENKGFIMSSFFSYMENSKFIFLSGPFYKKIFKIINREKNFIDVSINNFNLKIKNKNLVFKNL